MEEEHVRAVAKERADAARYTADFLESVNAPIDEVSNALEEESYWWGVYERGVFDEDDES